MSNAKRKDVAIDPETGMPVLPDGYFWRIITSGMQEDQWGRAAPVAYVQIRKRGKMYWFRNGYKSSVVAERGMRLYERSHEYVSVQWVDFDEEFLHANIQIVAQDVYLEFQNELDQARIQAATRAMMSKTVGDYPPKKLEV